MNEIHFRIGDETVTPPLGSKMVGVNIRRGDSVHISSPGGGGFGDPADRDADALDRDVRLGYVSPAAAARDYGARS